MSNETKIGLLTIIAVSLLIWGYKFLSGKNILTSSTMLYAQYDNVDRLKTSAPVLINGFQVGRVSQIYFTDDMKKVEIELEIEKNVGIPKNTVAQIISSSVMGDKAVVLQFSGACNGANCAANGDYLTGSTKSLIASMIGSPTDLDPYVDVVKSGVTGIVDTLKATMSDPNGETNESVESVKTTITNLENATRKLDRIMSQSSGKIDGLLNNLQSITANINASNGQIKSMIANADAMTGNLNSQLQKVDLSTTMGKADTAMDNANDAISQLKGTLESTNKTMTELTDVLSKVNTGEGTLGMLVNDKDLYNDINKTVKNLDLLLEDFRVHPKRYTRILSKKEIPYDKN